MVTYACILTGKSGYCTEKCVHVLYVIGSFLLKEINLYSYDKSTFKFKKFSNSEKICLQKQKKPN